MAEAKDVIDLLIDDHNEVEELFSQLDDTPPDRREELFQKIVNELARHEAAEEAVVHPATRREAAQGDSIADSVIGEEQEAEELMAEMEGMDATSDEFLQQFRQLRDDVLEHAQHEEDTEFPRLRDAVSTERLVELGEAFQQLKKTAPTHPHPKTPHGGAARGGLGPVAGIFDRARDAAREAFSSS